MDPIDPSIIRYIKLGAGGGWARACLDQGEVHFGYAAVPHEMCLAGDWESVTEVLMENEGRSLSKARDGVREIRDFYTLGADCLWVTFADGHLWWAFAEPEVTWLGGDGEGQGVRMRKTVDGWCKTNVEGTPLRIDGLSTRLTQGRRISPDHLPREGLRLSAPAHQWHHRSRRCASPRSEDRDDGGCRQIDRRPALGGI